MFDINSQAHAYYFLLPNLGFKGISNFSDNPQVQKLESKGF